MVCLSTMASNSNVIKVHFEYTSTVVAKLVETNSFFLRFPLMYPVRCQPSGSPLILLFVFQMIVFSLETSLFVVLHARLV